MNIKKIFALLFLVFYFTIPGKSQQVGVKTNLLYGAYTATPNMGLEIRLAKASTLDIGVGYNPWNLNGSTQNNKKLVHWLSQVEYRRWLCQRFTGHFFGVHALGTQFNIAGHELPLLLEKGSKNYRYQGYGYGGGISYGYNFFLGKRWGLEATIGMGYARLHYDKYDCVKCGEKMGADVKNYFGPTRAGISLVYIIK